MNHGPRQVIPFVKFIVDVWSNLFTVALKTVWRSRIVNYSSKALRTKEMTIVAFHERGGAKHRRVSCAQTISNRTFLSDNPQDPKNNFRHLCFRPQLCELPLCRAARNAVVRRWESALLRSANCTPKTKSCVALQLGGIVWPTNISKSWFRTFP